MAIAMILPPMYVDNGDFSLELRMCHPIGCLQVLIYWYEVRKAIRSGELSLQVSSADNGVIEPIWDKIVKEYGKPTKESL